MICGDWEVQNAAKSTCITDLSFCETVSVTFSLQNMFNIEFQSIYWQPPFVFEGIIISCGGNISKREFSGGE